MHVASSISSAMAASGNSVVSVVKTKKILLLIIEAVVCLCYVMVLYGIVTFWLMSSSRSALFFTLDYLS